jgi:hypothetical protein
MMRNLRGRFFLRGTFASRLRKGECAVISVEQRGIDVGVQLEGSNNQPIVEADDELGKLGTEKLDIVADYDGTYTVSVTPKLKVASGAYEVRLVEVRPATYGRRQAAGSASTGTASFDSGTAGVGA